MKEFKIRCSALSKIMAGEIGLTETQSARYVELAQRNGGEGKPLTDNMKAELSKLAYKLENPELPQGAKTYVQEWLKQNLYKRKKDFKVAVIEKGLQCELDGIKLIAETFGFEDFEKNEEHFENDYIEGSPDVLHNAKVRDTKLSWDLFTFPMFETETPNLDYDWQIQGYFILTGLVEGSLDYVLIDTPQPLIDQDLKKLYFQSGGKAEDWRPEDYAKLYENYKFSDIPAKDRIKSFVIKKRANLERDVKERVLLCRAYIKTLLEGRE